MACSEALSALDHHKDRPFWNTSSIFYGSGALEGKSFFISRTGKSVRGNGPELACMFPQAMDAIDAANDAFLHFQQA